MVQLRGFTPLPPARRFAGAIAAACTLVVAPLAASVPPPADHAQSRQHTDGGLASLAALSADEGMASVFEAYCLEMFQYRSTNRKVYGPEDGAAASDAGTVDRLARLMALLGQWNGDNAITPQETATLRTAIWDIAGESDASMATLRLDLGSSDADEPVVNGTAPPSPGSATQVKWLRRV